MENYIYSIESYKDQNGKSSFEDWLNGLRDRKVKTIILQRINRVRFGSFGNYRAIGFGVYELKIFWGPGYRIYYGIVRNQIVLLLCGGDKSSQQKDILKAQKIWKEYNQNAD